MVTSLLAIGGEPLELARIAEALGERRGGGPLDGSGQDPSTGSGQDGAVVTFLGLVRNHNLGRSVRYLEYEAYEPLALKAFERIAREIAERWPSARLALHHRVGKLEVGEASVAIAARSPHRGDAYAACRYAIERVKQIAPDLEARVLRGRRRLDRRGDGGSRRPARARGSRADRMRVTVRLFARLRDIAGRVGAGARAGAGRDDRRRVAAAGAGIPGAGELRALDFVGGERRLRADGSGGRRRRRSRVPAAGLGWIKTFERARLDVEPAEKRRISSRSLRTLRSNVFYVR